MAYDQTGEVREVLDEAERQGVPIGCLGLEYAKRQLEQQLCGDDND